MTFPDNSGRILRLYFGLEQGRSIKKKKLFDELIRRGVSVYAVTEAIERLLDAVGWAADNRIEEIDAQMDP